MQESIKPNTVVRTILNRIKEALISKEFLPGCRLPSEKEIAESFGVGKSSVREAIKMLDAVGVVESRQGEGTFICKEPKEDSLNPLIFQLIVGQGTNEDLLEFRMMYETAYTLMAMREATEEDINHIRNIIENFEQMHNEGKEIPTNDDATFHRAILRSTHNPFVIRTGEVLIELFEVSIRNPVDFCPENSAIDDHRRIFDALCKKDEAELRTALQKSFKGWAKQFLGKQ